MIHSRILPQPSQQFIEKYIECYNKGKVITDVLVEQGIDKITMACTCAENEETFDCVYSYTDAELNSCCQKRFPNGEYWNKTFKLKVNPKDNTITIKKLKDSWNREEVINILYKHTEELLSGKKLTLFTFIEENL
jgi:ketol-acid reductoisomerase